MDVEISLTLGQALRKLVRELSIHPLEVGDMRTSNSYNV